MVQASQCFGVSISHLKSFTCRPRRMSAALMKSCQGHDVPTTTQPRNISNPANLFDRNLTNGSVPSSFKVATCHINCSATGNRDRKSVVQGKSVSVRENHG